MNPNEVNSSKKKPESPSNLIENQLLDNPLLSSTITKSFMAESKISTAQKQRIIFTPKQLVFNIKNSQERQIIEVQNVTGQPLRLKIARPKTRYFRIIYENLSEENSILCPGLSKKIQVEYKRQQKSTIDECKSRLAPNDQIFDIIKLQLQTKTYEVPLQAIKQTPKLDYEKLIDMKFVDMNKLMKIHRTIKNTSSETVKIKLLKQSWDNMHIVPQQTILKPNSEETLEFSTTPTIVGTYHHKILVQVNNVAIDPIEVIYSTYDYNYCIVDDNGAKISELDFGYMYFGSKKQVTLYAVNNTPNLVEMKGKVRIGYRNNPLEATFQSPQEFGQQCSATLIEIHPKSLRIEPFSKEKFILSSMGRITDDHLSKVIKYAKSQTSPSGIKTHKRMAQTIEKYKIEDEEFHECFISEFTVLNNQNLKDSIKPNVGSDKGRGQSLNFKNKDKYRNNEGVGRTSIISNVVLTQLKVYYGLPTVKISPLEFDFGKVIMNKPASQSFTLTNLNVELPVRISFNKIIGIEIFPKQSVLKPNQTTEFQVYLTPINLGTINEVLKVTIEDNYVIQCKIRYEVVSNRSLFKLSTAKQKVLHKSLHCDSFEGKQVINFNSTMEVLQKTCHNQVYSLSKPQIRPSHSNSLFNIRKNPSASIKQKERMSSANLKNLSKMYLNSSVDPAAYKALMGGNNPVCANENSTTEIFDSGDNSSRKKKKINSAEIQQLEEQCQNSSTVKDNKIALPQPKESLFVTKKIDKYEPYSQGHNTRKLLKSKTSKDFFSNVPKRQPRNRREVEEISMELKGESLKLIKINTKNISFGKMFVGSRMQKEFVVENDTEYSIEVKLKEGATETAIEKLENQMLTGTDYGEQIISSHSLATFGINLFAKECGKFEKAITYTINKVHEFQFLVQAEIQLAALTINKNVLKMSYLDDLTEMFLKDSFMLKNDGNATTEFSISQQYDHFMIEPAKGIVEPGATIDVFLTYKCAVQTLINAGDSLPMSANNKSQKMNPNSNSNNLSISSTVNGTQSNQGMISNSSMNQNFMDERISVDIKNGINMSMRVTFNPNITEPRCVVKESKINFGVTIVSKPKTKSFLLRNVSRTMTLFEIQNNECSEFLYFDMMKGKLPPESSKEITITYKSSIIQQVESFFKINIRGGLTINVPIVAESVAPNIRLEEEIYNFGDVCCGSSQVKAVHVVNESETVVELLLDLLDKRVHGTEYLYVSFMGQEHHTVFDETTGNQKPGILKNKLNDNHQTTSSGFQTQDQAIIDNACMQPQIHKLKVQPKSIYTFYIVFKPKLPGYYEFELPLYLENFIKNEALNKIVTCFATEPKFIVEPSVIRFKKKIINEKESTAFHPLIQFVTLKNPGDKELKWKIDFQNSSNSTSTNLLHTLPHGPGSIKSFNSIVPSNSSNNLSFNNTQPISFGNSKYSQQPDTRFCFEIENKKGTVKPQSWECINIAFNPYEAGVYCYKLPLLIYNEERGLYQQEAEIRLEGEGQYPTLFFDRKEVIMPVVPLGVQSVAMFKLINQGYESISLKHRIQMYDMQGNCIIQGSNYYQNPHNNHSTIPEISVIYPEGIKMGINKKELYIIVKFSCKKPISFTCKLQLYDNTKDSRVYSIPVSGTTDSSILTLFPYLSDPQNRYKLVPSNHVTPSNHIEKLKKEQPNYVINLESTDDRNAVDKFHNPYEKMSTAQFTIDCEIIRRWMNAFLKDERVGKFPQDVINCPQNLLKILFKMTYRKEFETLAIVVNSESQQSNGQSANIQSRDPPTQPQSPKNNPYFTSTLNNSNNIFAQFLSVPAHFGSKLQFYEYLIKLLKSMGCLLNHIRPYFLLKKEEFFSYIEKDPNWKNMAQTYSKNYECMHLEAWIVLFYQIVSNFWYNTAKLKSTLSTNDKNHQSLQTNNSSSNTSNNQVQSNIYSATEMAVLRWVKNIYEKYNQFQDTFFRFVSYGEDFRDSVGLIYSIYHHIINPQKKKKSLEGLTRKPLTPNEVTSNVRILYQLIEKIGLVPLIYEEEFPLIKQKETFLFMYQLFELLPQQLPKSDPIYFTCNLGEKCTKFIEIKNPSNKVVLYWVRLEGSRDFSHEEKEFIKLEPKSTYKFKVNFESRISKEEIAYLTFLNKLESTDTSSMANTVTNPNANAAAGSTLVFELRSKIVGRKSIKKLEPIYCPIYESQMIRIPVDNQFDCEFANFEIHLFQEVLEGNSGETKPKLYPLRKIKHELTQSSEDDPVPQTDKKSLKSELEPVKDKEKEELKAKQSSSLKEELVNFFVDNETIKIKKNSSSYIELMFNPVLYHKIKCYLIFHDPLVGEFQYEIIGISEIPKVLHELKYPSVIYTSMKETLEVSIPLYNNFMIKSNLLMEQKLYSKNGRQKPLKKQDDLQDTYKIQVNMDQKILQYVTFPQEFILKSNKKQSIDSMSKLKLECSFPVVVKDLALDFLMINQSKTDVRRIKLHLNLATKPIVSDIIIKTTARVPIIQPIPIQNTSAKDWRVKATLGEDEECQKLGYLSLKEGERMISKDFIVKRANVGNVSQVPTSSNLLINSSSCTNNTTNTQILTLVFSPKWVCKISGKLTIQNITTNEQLIYHIKAFAEEPVSEGHIYFKLRTSTEESKKITIKNPYNEALTFRIESDIEEMIKLPQYIYLDAHGEASITATMEALIPSKNIGYIKLTDQRSRFFWYTLTIESYDDSQPQKILEITSQVGQSVEKSLDIYNPTNQKLRFVISYPENAFVKGEPYVDVEPHANAQAIVTFSPQVSFTSKSQIRITNKLAGSILYKLSLTAIQPMKKTCQTLSAEVNKSAFTSFKITNSLKNPIRIKCELSESRYFELQYNEVIPAKTDAEVKVQFRPLEEGKYPCVLKIFGEQLQTKCYEIEGIGLKPFTVEKIQMKTSCGSPCLEIIKFKNPNPKKIKEKVEIQIEDKEFNHNCFRVISQKGEQQTWQTSVADVLAVPIQFNPVEKGYFQSMLYIRCAHYQWKYMLKGTTNTKTSSEVQQKIEGECRKQVIKIMKIPIPNYLRKQENFTSSMLDKVEIECDDSKAASKIKSWMQIKIQTPLELEEKTPLEEEQLTLMCKFTPLQPLQEIVNFNISHAKSQGSIRLSHKVKLSIKPCEPEQTITIDVSSIKKYKFDINLDEIGVIAKKGQPVHCAMLKKQLVECKFKSPQNSQSSQNNSMNSSMKNLANLRNSLQNSSVVEVSFSPNNLVFNSTKAKNQYSDVLMVFTEKNFWNCEIIFKLSNNAKKP